MTLSDIFLFSYSKVFPPVGWDPVRERVPEKDGYKTINLANRAIQLTSIAGLPNDLTNADGEIEVEITSDNYSSWETDKKVLWKVWKNMTLSNESDALAINITRAILPLLAYSLYGMFSTIRSTARIFTELLPSTFANLFKYAANSLDVEMRHLIDQERSFDAEKDTLAKKEQDFNEEKKSLAQKMVKIPEELRNKNNPAWLKLYKKTIHAQKQRDLFRQTKRNSLQNNTFSPIKNITLQVLISFGYSLTRTSQFLFESIHFFGKSITHPVKGLRSAWKSTHKYAGDNLLGDILGVLMVGLSAASTFTAIAFLFPFVASLFTGFAIGGGAVALLINIISGAAPLSSTLLLLLNPVFEIGMGIGSIIITYGICHAFDPNLEKNIRSFCKITWDGFLGILESAPSDEAELDSIKINRVENMIKDAGVGVGVGWVERSSAQPNNQESNHESNNPPLPPSLGYVEEHSTQPTPRPSFGS